MIFFFSDSLSALQALGKLKTDHPLIIQIQELLHSCFFFLCGFLDMLVFEETRLLIELRKTLLIQNRQPISCLFLYLKPLTAKYVYQIWQKKKTKKKKGGGDETVLVSNKFHEYLPNLPDTLLSFFVIHGEHTLFCIDYILITLI